MSRAELAEWFVMIVVIVAWWPYIFLNWQPMEYRVPLYIFSGVSLVYILVRRLARLREGFAVSEQMMHAKRVAEDQARGRKPMLDEKEPPDVSSQLPFLAPPPAPDEGDRDRAADEGGDEEDERQ